jgi:spore coat protein CotH
MEPSAPIVGPGAVVAEPADEASHIFDPKVLHTFDVEVAATDLAAVDANPAAEQYVPARLTFEGTTHEIGYRYKGSIGAFFPPCTNLIDGSKQGKCSVKLSFNWMSPDGKFFGLKKLLFHSMNNDPSMMRERLGYALFRRMGVPASRATHAILRVNGKAEIYAMVEEIDGRFARSRFTEGGKGNLYKEIWPTNVDPQAYIKALETNEDAMPSVDRVLRFQKAIVQGPDAMATFLDHDVTTSYMAVDRVLVNDDGAFHLYCGGSSLSNNPNSPSNHNYYWYEAKDADRLWLIPWDLDHAMSDRAELPHIATDWRRTPTPEECNACGGLSAGPPSGCDRVIQNFQAWLPAYDAKIDRLISGPFSKAVVDEELASWKQQLMAAGFPVGDAPLSDLIRVLDAARVNRGYKY